MKHILNGTVFRDWYIRFKYLSKVVKAKESSIVCNGSVFMENPKLIEFEGAAYLGPRFRVMNKGRVLFGDNVIFGPEVIIVDYNHDFYSNEMVPYSNNNKVLPVTVRQNVWVGARAIILPGVTIGEGAIIGAGSVVTKNVAARKVVAGNPSREIGERPIKEYELMANDKSCKYLHCKNYLV